MASCLAQRDNKERNNTFQPRNGEICQVCDAPRKEKECAYRREVRVAFARGIPELEDALDTLTDQLKGIHAFYEKIKIDCDLDAPWMFGSCAVRCTLANFVKEFLKCTKVCRELNFKLEDPNIKIENKLRLIEEAAAKLAQVTKDWTKFHAQWPTTGRDLSKIAL